MAKISRFMVLLALGIASMSVSAQTPTPIAVTGTLGSISGAPQPYAGVLIQLQNCPSPVTITGYAAIVLQAYQLQANSSGLINSTVWANDQITCNGTTGQNYYSEVAIVSGTPQGTTQCYQVTQAQGVWNLNTQQPITCGYTPPNPTDGSFRNLTSTGFIQGNNGAMTGSWTDYGLLSALGGFTLGTTAQNCSVGQFVTGLSTALAPSCGTPAPTPAVTSINATTGDFTFTGADVSCTGTTCTFGTSGSIYYQGILQGGNTIGNLMMQRYYLGIGNGLVAQDVIGSGSHLYHTSLSVNLTGTGTLVPSMVSTPGTAATIPVFDGSGNITPTTSTSGGCASSATGGCVLLPGGMILQWVKGSADAADASANNPPYYGQNVNWPTAFSTACYAPWVVTTTSVASNTVNWWYQIQAYSATGATVNRQTVQDDAGVGGSWNGGTTTPIAYCIGK